LKFDEFQLQRRANQILNHRVVNLVRNPLTLGNALLETQVQSLGSPARKATSHFNHDPDCKTDCQNKKPRGLPEIGF
jgi:hypothetical protein